MIARVKRRPNKSAAWHAGFLAMLPVIVQYARGAFGHLNPEARQDLVQEVIANALVAYVRLFQQGRVALAYRPSWPDMGSPRSGTVAASATS